MTTFEPARESTPLLYPSQLKFRLGLVRNRLRQYPLHKLDFIMMDLERPDRCSRHAHWCTGDLTGRTLDFVSRAQGIDGTYADWLDELFERIWRTRRASGLFGRYACSPSVNVPPEEWPGPPALFFPSGADRLLMGLISYYDATGDWRGLHGATGVADWFVQHKDRWAKYYEGWCFSLTFWIAEPFSRLYEITGNEAYLDFVAMLAEAMAPQRLVEANLHGTTFLIAMRGLQRMAMITGDGAWNETPEFIRRTIIDEPWEYADGAVSESLPRNSCRNEGCVLGDWLQMNLFAGLISGQDEAFEKAQHVLWNAVFHNQFINGSFGHRDFLANGRGYAAGPVGEAWWCCAMNAGLSLVEFARHAVVLRGKTVEINQLVPGRFRLPMAGRKDIEVDVRTPWPAEAKAVVTVRNLPEDLTVKLRVPACVRNASVEQTPSDGGTKLRLSGRIGHTVEPWQDGQVLKYGPLILAPMAYYWDMEAKASAEGVPEGYMPDTIPGVPELNVGAADEDGFVSLDHLPLPDWTYFDEGPGAELAVENASAHVPLRFEDGQEKTLYFWPMCEATSNLVLYDTPILFRKS